MQPQIDSFVKISVQVINNCLYRSGNLRFDVSRSLVSDMNIDERYVCLFTFEERTLKNETSVTCGRRLWASFQLHSSRESCQKFNSCSPNAPTGIAYKIYSRNISVSSSLGSFECEINQFIACFAQPLPVAARAFSLECNKNETPVKRYSKLSQLQAINTYALSLDIPKNISVCRGVFSGFAKCTIGLFFRGGGSTGIIIF